MGGESTGGSGRIGADLPHRVGTGIPEEVTSNVGDGYSRQTPCCKQNLLELRTKVAGHRGRRGPMEQERPPGMDALPTSYLP